MLLFNSFERSERVYQAMLARGFNNKIYVNQDSKLHADDLIFFIKSLLVLSWFIVIDTGILS
ncbi:MAG: hypothetical protein BHK79_01685 [Halanaerobium sp. MDAL1]|jgi:cobalt/nickel transport system permease protein|nr:MAG: hypothetical protein AWL62_2419 [Halanaerobium sp. T82-1]OEG63593.1 MAG: hypothetical protein BHK79_01685 [Halanaerobium sp. MDAL1]